MKNYLKLIILVAVLLVVGCKSTNDFVKIEQLLERHQLNQIAEIEELKIIIKQQNSFFSEIKNMINKSNRELKTNIASIKKAIESSKEGVDTKTNINNTDLIKEDNNKNPAKTIFKWGK